MKPCYKAYIESSLKTLLHNGAIGLPHGSVSGFQFKSLLQGPQGFLRVQITIIGPAEDKIVFGRRLQTHSLLSQGQKSLLLTLFDELREKCREVLYLWAAAYSMAEIAEELAYASPQVAMNKKNKCLKQLQDLIGSDKKVQSLLKELS